ncbi:MAG: hypothetical protein M1835_002897 [Candelina submexicana]|nr:MAG: hypothetical protein M1835_002897 [Candelina submexicana]
MAQCFLLSQPLELRNEIYFYILIPSSPLEIPSRHERKHTASRLAILQTCHQINNEASPIFYASNVFEKRINSVTGPPNLTGIPKSAFFKMTHIRLVVEHRIPDLLEKERIWSRERYVVVWRCWKNALVLEKLVRDHPGIETLTISNYDSFTAFNAWQETGEPVQAKYRRTIEAGEYEFRRSAKCREQSKIEASAEIPKTATVEYLGDLTHLGETEAKLKSMWEPWLRLRPKKLYFEGLGERRVVDRDQSASERRWAQVPRWIV